ncbi:MAG: glycosyltransferase family 4 protein [Clostridia bacterium]|nr:glycosyltransferase family 4 protein [Clostridia bacterium]
MEKKIKICAITTISATMDSFMVDSMRVLAKNGYDVTLVCNMDEDFIARNSDFAKCIHVPMKRGVSFFDVFRSIKTLRKVFKKEQFDALYYATPNAAIYAAVAGSQAKIKTRIYNQCGIRYVALTGWKRKLFKMIEKFTCKKSTHVRSVSPLNMQFAIDEGVCPKEKIAVIGIGGTTGVDLKACDAVDIEKSRKEIRERYQIPQDAFVYGFVGRVNRDKGINELVKAYFLVQQEDKNAYLMLIGDKEESNPVLPETEMRIREDEKIVATGNVPGDEVYTYMSAFDVLVHPTYREGYGKVLQEAMGMRLPIITTDVIGPKEVVENGEYGMLVPVKDAESLATAMQMMANDEELRKTLAQKGRARAEKYYDRPIMTGNVLREINAILGINK